MPQVAGSVLWAKHLLKRVVDPMKNFEAGLNMIQEPDKETVKTVKH